MRCTVGLFSVSDFYDDIIFFEQGGRIGDIPVLQAYFILFQILQAAAEHDFVFSREDVFYEQRLVQIYTQSPSLSNSIERVSLVCADNFSVRIVKMPRRNAAVWSMFL